MKKQTVRGEEPKEFIKKWIIENSEDELLMDYVNSISFPFTSKHKRWQEEKEYSKLTRASRVHTPRREITDADFKIPKFYE